MFNDRILVCPGLCHVFLISNIKFLVTDSLLAGYQTDDCLSVKFSVVTSFDLFYDKLLNLPNRNVFQFSFFNKNEAGK